MTAAHKEPHRTCVGCRESFPQEELVRIAVLEEPPWVVPDVRRRLGGRGVWVRPRRECIEKAARHGGFARALKRKVSVDAVLLREALEEQLRRRLEGLLGGGNRAGHLGLGTDAVRQQVVDRAARLLWVAEDAAGRREELVRLMSEQGRPVITLGSKAEMGSFFDREELGVLSVRDEGLARAIGQVLGQLADLRGSASRTHKEAREA